METAFLFAVILCVIVQHSQAIVWLSNGKDGTGYLHSVDLPIYQIQHQPPEVIQFKVSVDGPGYGTVCVLGTILRYGGM